jgi:hypothetical protein
LPSIEDVQDWYFTFGLGHYHAREVFIIRGTFEDARDEMNRLFGKHWCWQYSEEEGKEQVKKWSYSILDKVDLSLEDTEEC